ncbi:MAG: hypothetical protein Q7J47_06850 [Azoarcus sp.]|nr:hypothetical protein [Azoarcus sp.]
MALNTLALTATPGTTAPELLVLLAGAYDKPADFLSAGFDTALRASGRAIDLILVESDLSAVCDGSLSTRIEDEILVGARQSGYQRVLTGGISIGGLAALMHADHYPGGSDGLVLIAPYPGNRSITGEIDRAGGLANWPANGNFATNDERCGWRALQRCGPQRAPPVWLGYGGDDRFAGGHAMMAAVLAEADRCVLSGGHDWPTWLCLWQRYLADHG